MGWLSLTPYAKARLGPRAPLYLYENKWDGSGVGGRKRAVEEVFHSVTELIFPAC